MRLAVFSDVHGNLAALEAVLADISEQRADRLVCLGDLAYNGPWPGECVAAVRDAGALCVHGNTDRAVLRAAGRLDDGRPIAAEDRLTLDWHVARLGTADLDFLASLRRNEQLGADGIRMLFVHASVKDVTRAIRAGDTTDTLIRLMDDAECDWIFLGHTHVPCLFQLDGRRIINTGAVSRSLDGNGRPSYVIVDTRTGGVCFRRVDYDIDRTLSAARERGFPYDLAGYERFLRTGTAR